MQIITVVIIAAVVFGVCFLVDKGFAKLFRSQAQHASGLAVRLSKRYGSIGLVLVILGLLAVFSGLPADWVLIVGGIVVALMGIGLVVYYMNYGVFYNEDGFLFMRFGKANMTYRYADIAAQQLYNNQGHLLIELHMTDGNTVQLQSTMDGCYAFMDYAFFAWLQQTGRKEADCPFYDPKNSCWFPPVKVEE